MPVLRICLPRQEDENVIAAKREEDIKCGTQLLLEDGVSCIASYDGRFFNISSGRTFLWCYQRVNPDFRPPLLGGGPIQVNFYAYKTNVDAVFGFGGDTALRWTNLNDHKEYSIRGYGSYTYQIQDYQKLISKINATPRGVLIDTAYSDYIRDNFGLVNHLKNEIGKILETCGYENLQSQYLTIGNNTMREFNRCAGANLGVRIETITIQSLNRVD